MALSCSILLGSILDALKPSRICYNRVSYFCLMIYLVGSLITIIIARQTLAKSGKKFHCTMAGGEVSMNSSSVTINKRCLRKYEEKSSIFLIEVLLILTLVTVFLLSLTYSLIVKGRVKKFKTSNDENQSLLQPSNFENTYEGRPCLGKIPTFWIYILHLIFCRIIPSLIFSIPLLLIPNPSSFSCPWPLQVTDTSKFNATLKKPTIHCGIPMARRGNAAVLSQIVLNFFFVALAFIELALIFRSKCKDCEFSTDKEFCTVYLLSKRKVLRKRVDNIRQALNLDNILKVDDDFGELKTDDNCDRRRPLDQIYVNIAIQEWREHASTYPTDFDRKKIYDSHLTTAMQNTFNYTSAADVFKPKEGDEGDGPRTILVIGRPGIGKTIFTKKILHEWQQKKDEFWLMKMVLVLQFDKVKDKEKISFREMLRSCDGLTNENDATVLSLIMSIPTSTVLIFDGLDKVDVNNKEKTVCRDMDKKMPVSTIFQMLIDDDLLPGVKVLVTSRSTTQCLSRTLHFDRTVEIMGFSEGQIEEYVDLFCENKETSGKIWNQINGSPELRSLCYIPVNSYIVCLTLKEIFENYRSEEQHSQVLQRNTPKTMTELYKRGIKAVLYRHHPKCKKDVPYDDYLTAPLSEDDEVELEKLEPVAINRFQGERFPFKSTKKDFGSQENCGFFHKLELYKTESYYIFLHLTMQEFLVASHLIVQLNELEEFLQAHVGKSKWNLVIQFIAGLLGDEYRRAEIEQKNCPLKQEIACHTRTIIDRIMESFEKWAILFGSTEKAKNEVALLGIKCLYELQEIERLKLVAKKFKSDSGRLSLKDLSLTPHDSAAVFEFIGNSTNIKQLEFMSCTIQGIYSYEKMEQSLFNNPVITTFKSIDSLTDEGVKYLSYALKSKSCNLTELELIGSDIKDKSIEHITIALKERCKLVKLHIGPTRMTNTGVECLCDYLVQSENCTIRDLGLCGNKITDEGVQYLSNALSQCILSKFVKLYVLQNDLKDESVDYLCKAIEHNSNGAHLELHLSAKYFHVAQINNMGVTIQFHNFALV